MELPVRQSHVMEMVKTQCSHRFLEITVFNYIFILYQTVYTVKCLFVPLKKILSCESQPVPHFLPGLDIMKNKPNEMYAIQIHVEQRMLEFGTDYVNFLSHLTCLISGIKEIKQINSYQLQLPGVVLGGKTKITQRL